MIYRILEEEEKEPNAIQETGRHIARSGSRIGETILGLPGDIISSVTGLAQTGIEKIAGKAPFSKEQFSKFIPGLPPTSQKIRETFKEPTKGYLEPKNELEELSDEIVSDVASLAVPVKGKIPFARALFTGVGANIAKETAKAFGVEDIGQNIAKLGTMFLLGSLGRGTVGKYRNSLYKKVNELTPEGVSVNGQKLEKTLNHLEKNLMKGLEAPSESEMLKIIRKLKEKIKKGKIGVDELVASKRSLNEQIRKIKDLKDPGARKLVGVVSHEMNESLKEYGKKNPEFWKSLQDANLAHGAIEQSKKITNFLRDKIDFTPKNAVLLGLFHGLGAVKAAGATYASVGAIQLLQRINANPVLRRYYLNVIKESAKGNALLMNKELKKLDDELSKEKTPEKTGKYRLID